MNRYVYIFTPYALANYVGKRDSDPVDDCSFFVRGLKIKGAECDTDGHYMCDYCIHNRHQNKEYCALAIETGSFT